MYRLLDNEHVQKFIGTKEYNEHKEARFPPPDFAIPIAENESFLINDVALRKSIQERFKKTANLYYNGQPDFDEILAKIKANINKL